MRAAERRSLPRTGSASPSGNRVQGSPLRVYFGRMRGKKRRVFVRPPFLAFVVGFCACFIGLFVIDIPSLYGYAPASTRLFLIGSFGASATLLYGAPQAEFAQPRSMLLGQLIAAFMGVTAYKLFGSNVGIAAGMAVGSATVIMMAAGCIHPPAGATALIAVLGPAQVHHLSYLYVLTPVLVTTAVIIVVGLALLNLNPDQSRHYPTSWW